MPTRRLSDFPLYIRIWGWFGEYSSENRNQPLTGARQRYQSVRSRYCSPRCTVARVLLPQTAPLRPKILVASAKSSFAGRGAAIACPATTRPASTLMPEVRASRLIRLIADPFLGGV